MAEENLKDFAINWIISGLLVFSMMSFAIVFMFNNNPGGMGDETDETFSKTVSNVSGGLYKTPTDSDTILNITANTNPEASDLGSRDSVATAYGIKATGTGFFESLKIFISWVLVGDMGKMLIAVFGGLTGLISVYFIVKWIRNGI
jgi:hypothetical protein